MGKKSRKILVAIYILIILWETLLSREPGTVRVFKGLFWEAQMGYWTDIRLNILLFLPLGLLLGTVTDDWRIVLLGFILSVFIELLQYVLALGWCQADDVLNNTIGALLGICINKLCFTVIRKARINGL